MALSFKKVQFQVKSVETRMSPKHEAKVATAKSVAAGSPEMLEGTTAGPSGAGIGKESRCLIRMLEKTLELGLSTMGESSRSMQTVQRNFRRLMRLQRRPIY
jgi:hypothetical protein